MTDEEDQSNQSPIVIYDEDKEIKEPLQVSTIKKKSILKNNKETQSPDLVKDQANPLNTKEKDYFLKYRVLKIRSGECNEEDVDIYRQGLINLRVKIDGDAIVANPKTSITAGATGGASEKFETRNLLVEMLAKRQNKINY